MDDSEAERRLMAAVARLRREQRETACRRCVWWAVAGLVVLLMVALCSL